MKTSLYKFAIPLTALVLYFFSGNIAQLNAQTGCSSITWSVTKLEPCKYRLFVNNTNLDCYNEATLLLQAGYYTGFTANSADGWVVEQLSSTELLLTHTNGLFPVGATRTVDFQFFEPGGSGPTFSVLYPNLCVMEGCAADFPLEGCDGGCVSGTVYRECQSLPYSNQPPIAGTIMELLDAMGTVISSAETDPDGYYSFCDLAPGQYFISKKPGNWSACVPATGMYAITVIAGGNLTRNFGLCPGNCVSGTVYRECHTEPYTNQPVLEGLTIELLDAMGTVLSSTISDADGFYSVCDLTPGNYFLRMTPHEWWTPKIPATGMYAISMTAGGKLTRNFGLCPKCSCDSLNVLVFQEPSMSADTNTYYFQTQSNPYCFPNYTLTIENGTLVDYTLLDTNATLEQTGPNSLKVSRCCYVSHVPYVKFRIAGPGSQNIVVSGAYDIGAGPVSCSKEFKYPPHSSDPCCPAGTVPGPELVVNGDFEAGNTGFTSGHTYKASGPLSSGQYTVPQSNQIPGINGQWACTDHTSGSPTGKMLVVDGSLNPPAITNVWRQNVTVVAGKTYTFSAWVNNLVIPAQNYNDPLVELYIDGKTVAGISLPENPDEWRRMCVQWTAPASGVKTLEVRTSRFDNVGNDFAVDDISFRSCDPAPCQTAINVTQNQDCTVTVCAVTTGPQPVTYQWCDGRTDPCFTTAQTPCVPATYCVTATCADGATAVATVNYTVTDITPPVAVCALGLGVTLLPDCTFPVTTAFVDEGSSDNCGIQSMSVNPSLLTGCGITIVTLTVTDWCGNTSTCTMGIQTLEIDPPVLTGCPQDISVTGVVNTAGVCEADVQVVSPVVSDLCSPPVTLTNSFNGTADASGSYPQGTTTVTWTAVDGCGNEATCSFKVTVTCGVEICCPEFTLAQLERIDTCPKDTTCSNSVHSPGTMRMLACKNSTHTYYVFPNLPGFSYNWTVTGGTLTSSQGNNPGVILWGNGSHGSLQVVITDATGNCRDTLTKVLCLLDAPIAAFTVAPGTATVCINQSVSFTNTSVGANTYLWDFGDGTSSTAPNPPPHIFPAPGTYTVLLTVSNGANTNPQSEFPCGCTDTAQLVITVLPDTGLTITSGCKKMLCPLDTATYCVSPGCAPYNWTVNGGIIIANNGSCITVQWDATAPPTLPSFVSVTAGCGGPCGSSAVLNVPVLWPNLPISGPNPVCVGSAETYSLPVLPGTFYSWSVSGAGGAIVGPNQNTPGIVVQWGYTAGTYTITCNYNNPYSGCSGSSTMTVQVLEKFVIGGSSSVCVGTPELYTVTSGGTANWTINAPPSAYSTSALNNVLNITVTWNTPGNYSITAVPFSPGPSNYCNPSSTVSVLVKPAPVLTLTGPTTICANQLNNYTASSTLTGGHFMWTFSSGTGAISPYGPDDTNASVNFTGSGPWTLVVTQTVNDCIGTASITANSVPPPVITSPAVTACIGATVTVTATGVLPLTWSTSAAATLVGGQGTVSATYEIHANGTITVSNCGGSSFILVSTTSPTAISIQQTGTLCAGNAQLTVTGSPPIPPGTTYIWYEGGTVISPNSNPIAVVNPGGYTVQATFPNGCISVATFTVQPEIMPIVTISTGDPLKWCVPATPTVLLQAFTQSAGCSYQWYESSSGQIIGATGQTYTVTAFGTYYVEVSCGACMVTSNSLTVFSDPCPPDPGCIGVPNPLGPITVTGSCKTITFDLNVTGCSGSQVDWNFGDGSSPVSVTTSGTVNTVSHTYTLPGAYIVIASITCNGCTFQVHTKVEIPVLANFIYSVQCSANGSYTVNLTNSSQTLGGWNVSNVTWTSSPSCGTPSSGSGNTFSMNIPAGCNPTVTMNITVTNSSNQSCTDSKTIPLNLPTQALSITGPTTVCKDISYTFNYQWTGPTIVQYQWTVGLPVSQNPSLEYAFGGSPSNQTVGLTIIDVNGCSYTASLPVTVYEPDPLTISPVKICPDCTPPASLSATPVTGFTNFQWYHNGTAIPGATSATYLLCNLDASGNYCVTAEDTQNGNCTAKSNTVQVTYHPKPVVEIQDNTNKCVSATGPYSINLMNVGGGNYTYLWTGTGPGGPVTISPNNTPGMTTSVPTLGSYQFILTVTDITTGCMASDTICVYLCLAPTVTVSGPTGTLCEGNSHTFAASITPSGNYFYQWSNGATGPVMTASQAGYYWVTVTDPECGCTNTSFAGHIVPTPSTILFPVGCDTLCNTASITPPLALGGNWPSNAQGYMVQWYLNEDYANPPFYTGTQLNLSASIPPLVYGWNNISIIVTYNGCSDTSDVYELFLKKCCVCKKDISLSQGGVEYPVFCDPHVGFIPLLPCPAKDVIVSGFIGFVDSLTGALCDETQVIWELVKPDSTIQGGITTNFTNFIFPKDSVNAPGLYCLTLTAISPDGLDTCVCKVTWVQESCDCCTTLEDFCARLENNVSLLVDNNACKVTLDVGNLPPCDYIEWVNWDYPNGQNQYGPFPAGSMPMHTYPSGGTYVVCYLAIEKDTTGKICYEKVVCDTISIDCPGCYCGTFTNLFFPLNRNTLGSSALCDGPEVMLGCPAPGKSIQLTGLLQCAGPSCPPTAQVTWELYRLPNTTTPVVTGSTTANPFFVVSILPIWYATPGSYELRLTGHCGTQKCPCIVRFKVDCPDPCPCDPTTLPKAVKKGFSVVSSGLSCKACFTPIALNDCDMVSWHLGSTANPSIGMTNGNQTLCHTFPGSGTYTVVMVVTRKKSDGSVCATETRTRTVKVNCIPIDICDNPVFKNPGFNDGANSGVLGAGGTSTSWASATGQPKVVEGSPGSLDAWTITLSGNFEAADALTTLEPLCLARDTGTIIIRAKAESPKKMSAERMAVDFTPCCVLDDTRTPIEIPLAAFDSAEWVYIEIPFDLSDYPDVDSCGTPMKGALVQPVVYVTNALIDDQGGAETRTLVEIDYFCYAGKLFTAVKDQQKGGGFRLYPNPTSGKVLLEWTAGSPKNARLILTDAIGRSIRNVDIPNGGNSMPLNLDELQPGMYFIQILSAERLYEVGRVVKQ